jgi:DNA-binding protein H-NS
MTELNIEHIIFDPYTTHTLIKLQTELIEAQQKQLDSNAEKLEQAKQMLENYQSLLNDVNLQLKALINKYE